MIAGRARKLRATHFLLCSLAWVCVGGPAPAEARLAVRATTTNTEIEPARGDTIAFRLELTARGTSERFPLRLSPPRFGREGSTIRLRSIRLRGSGRLGDGTRGSGIPACSSVLNRFHGFEPAVDVVDVLLPAESTSVVLLRYDISKTRPWRSTRYGVHVQLGKRMENGERGSLEHRRKIRLPEPRVLGRRALRLKLSTTPRTSFPAGTRDPEFARGGRIYIRGITDPVLAGTQVVLKYLRNGRPGFKRIGKATVRRDGSFRYGAWRPQQPGRYELWGFAQSASRAYASDYSCPRGFIIP
jgi:hypothetical protein